ncbi:MAG: hypothetical protein SFV19_17115 [Rhodospirillaceae bacterium]|nr:hypothetical protein [Rhodospirillaceae bacterium]
MKRVLLSAIVLLSVSGCVAYDMDNPALYDDPNVAYRDDPYAVDPFYGDPFFAGYRDSRRPYYGRPRGYGYYGYEVSPSRPKERMIIEDAQYESVNGRRVDANRYVRDECHGENNCDVKASNKIFGDPDVGARKDLVVRYRCGNGPSRTVRVGEKSEQDLGC